MMNVASSVGLRASIRQLRDAAVPAAGLNILLSTRGQGTLGEKLAKDILSRVADAQAGAVRELIARAGHRLIVIEEVSGLAAPPLQASVVSAEQAAQFAGDRLKAGEARLAFNPFTYSTLGAEDKDPAVQHELWHVLLNKVAPGFAAEMNALKNWFGPRAPYFVPNFLEPFAHFFTRVAALEAGCANYAIDNAVWELKQRKPVIDAGRGEANTPLWPATVFSGLLFSHVFCFELFPATDLAASNFEMIKLFAGGFMTPSQIQRTTIFAMGLQQALFLDRQDINMNGQGERVFTRWRQFAKTLGA
jgi:hypothetical protein